jgi:hypothetical protein
VARKEPWQPWRLGRWLRDLIKEKRKIKKTRAKLWGKVNCIYFDCWIYQSIGRGLYLYRQHNVGLWVRYEKIFSKQTKISNSNRTLCVLENRILRYPKPNSPVFAAYDFGLDFFYLGSMILLSHFSCLKAPLDLKIFKFSSCPISVLKPLKPDVPKYKIGLSNFSRSQIWSSTHERRPRLSAQLYSRAFILDGDSAIDLSVITDSSVHEHLAKKDTHHWYGWMEDMDKAILPKST